MAKELKDNWSAGSLVSVEAYDSRLQVKPAPLLSAGLERRKFARFVRAGKASIRVDVYVTRVRVPKQEAAAS